MSLIDQLNSITWGGSTLYGQYAGEAKGEGTSKKQLDLQNKLQQQAFDRLTAQQDKVSDAVSKYLSGNQGFDPQQLALLRSQFLNQNAQSYQQAGRNVRSALLRSGSLDSSVPAGGDAVRGIAGLEGAMASNASSGLANIDLQNLSQMLNNKFNAASLLNGQAATLTSPIASFGGGANNALDAYVQASNSGFGASFSRALGSGLGGGLAKIGTGALGGVLKSFGVPGMPSSNGGQG